MTVPRALTVLLAVALAACTPADRPVDVVATAIEMSPVPLPSPSPEPVPQPVATAPLLLVVDASGSMNTPGPDGRRLLDGVKDALRATVAELPEGASVGLRLYGSNRAVGCQDTDLVAPVAALDRARFAGAVDGYAAGGFSAIGLSLQRAVADLPPADRRTVVLVAEGSETCGPDPCEIAGHLVTTNPGLRVDTVGFAVGDAARAQLSCIAQAAGGTYREARDAATLNRELVLAARTAAGLP
jgi:Ca-activated chloride channel family protein